MNYSVVVVAAGSGSRLQLGYNKLLYEMNGKTMIEQTVQCFHRDPQCTQIILVHAKGEEVLLKEKMQQMSIEYVEGGTMRSDSVYAGLKHVNERLVLIHDGARPFVQQTMIDALLETLREYQACILAVPSKDTLKEVHNNIIRSTPDRSMIWQAQTPQAFHTELILHAYKQAIDQHAVLTDDASVVEQYSNQEVRIVMGSYDNIKITTSEDLKWFR